jgi:hypothetical protein
MDNQSEIDGIVELSINFIKENPHWEQPITNWINYGTSIYRDLYHLQNTTTKVTKHFSETCLKYNGYIKQLTLLLTEAGIVTNQEVIFHRETSYPVREKIAEKYIPFSVSSRDINSFPGCFGTKVYRVVVPIGTPIFFCSAVDLLRDMDLSETEEEFLVMGETSLKNDTHIIVSSI